MYGIFVGGYMVDMPLIVARGLTPATAEQVTDLRLTGELEFYTFYDTATGIAYSGGKQDRFKILPFSEDLAKIRASTALFNGGIRRSQDYYDSLGGREFTRRDMILGKRLKEEDALKHEGWLAALNDNQDLLERLVDHVFRELHNRGFIPEGMPFCLRDEQAIPSIHALLLTDFYDGVGARDSRELHETYCVQLVVMQPNGAESDSPTF